MEQEKPYWECGSGSRIIKIGQNLKKPGFLPFKRLTYFKYIFRVKIKLFVNLKSDQDPDLREFALVGSLDPDLSPDPDPRCNKCGSTTRLAIIPKPHF